MSPTGNNSIGKSGLQVNENFICDENELIEAYEFADKVKARVSGLGITSPPRPVLEEDHCSILPNMDKGQYFDGRMPTVIRTLTLDQLSSLYGLLRAHYAYLAFQTMVIAAERSEASRQKEAIWSSVRDQYKKTIDPTTGKRPTDQTASDCTRYDRRFVTFSSKYSELDALYEILEAMCNVAEQDMKVVSREVTIQQEKFRQKLLAGNFGHRGEFEAAVGGGYYGQGPAENTHTGALPGQRTARVQEPAPEEWNDSDTPSAPPARRPAVGPRRHPGPTTRPVDRPGRR